MRVNSFYKDVDDSYLFSTISRKVNEYQNKNPDADIIKMGIGDVTRPLCPAVVQAMEKACREMGKSDTFRGYGPYQGYMFLREKICKYYKRLGVTIKESEVFISDGAKSDIGNILDIFSANNTVLIPDPVYPVYVDTNIMDGRKIIYLDAKESNNFLPLPDNNVKSDIIYICSPNNPTGAAYNNQQLTKWVNYALKNSAVILYDAAYEAFIDEGEAVHSIFEIDGSQNCAIEFCSFSKTAGFTGTRCGYTIIPEALERESLNINKLWLRRQSTKFNGVSYIVQRGAEGVFSEEGRLQINESIKYYKENARLIAQKIDSLGLWFTGGASSPYIWLKCPKGKTSWEFFDFLLDKCSIVGTPGSGFGKNGEGFFRLSAFGSRENTKRALERIKLI